MSHAHEADHIRCDQVVEELWAYLDGELTPEANERMARHLASCSRCEPQRDFQAAFLRFLSRHAQQPVPPKLRRAVFEQLLEEEKRQRAG